MLTDYVRYSDDELATVAGKTATSLTGNAYFPNLPIPGADYTALVDDFRVKHQTAVNTGGRLDATAKNNTVLTRYLYLAFLVASLIASMYQIVEFW